jgi:cytochrome c oxidase subunit II
VRGTRASAWQRRGALGLLAGVTLAAASCADQEPGAFAPRGTQASEIAWLFWLMVGLGAAVFVLVLALFTLAARRRDERPRDRSESSDDAAVARSTKLVIGGGIVLPVVILVPLTFAMLVVADRISPHAADDALEIEIVGHQFWWEVRYPGTDAVTANEIHIPVDTPVRFVMTTEDVIHSVWVPQLAGKIDMIPGQTTYLQLDAVEPGEYWGYCAEFCGIQHARMRFLVIAHEPDAFDAWLANEAEPAREPTDEAAVRGEQVFADFGCAACHTVRGTDAVGDLGPDLTHLASRRTLGAATVPNTRGQLGGWVTDPQAVKPGNLMPPTPLGADELLDLLAYLEGLE